MAKFLFVTPYKWSERDYERFGATAMAAEGHSCEVSYTPPSTILGFIPSIVAFYKKIQHFAPDIVITNTRLSLKTWYVFYVLSRQLTKFGFLINASQPVSGVVFQGPSRMSVMTRLKQLQERFTMKTLDGILRRLPPKLLGLRYCDFIVVDGKRGSEVAFKIAHPSHPQISQIIPTHSLDYEQITFRKQESRSQAIPGNYIVFLDQYLEGHPDFRSNNINPPVSMDYEAQLQSFFRHFSQISGQQIVVAAHPKRPRRKEFAGCECFFGETNSLLNQCSKVIGHFSTALSMAVIFNKPCFILTSNELEKSSVFKNAIEAYANALHAPLMNIDKPLTEIPAHPRDLEGYYRNYFHSFIKQENSAAQSWWKTVLDKMTSKKEDI